jgi:hypothetical protein
LARLTEVDIANRVDNHIYYAFFRVFVTDDSVADSYASGTVEIHISYVLKSNKADDFIRQSLADVIKNGQTNVFPATGWIIDPDDIYIPFAR